MALLNNVTFEPLNDDDWFIIEKACEVVGIFNEITIEVGAEKTVTLSKIAVFTQSLIDHSEALTEVHSNHPKLKALRWLKS